MGIERPLVRNSQPAAGLGVAEANPMRRKLKELVHVDVFRPPGGAISPFPPPKMFQLVYGRIESRSERS